MKTFRGSECFITGGGQIYQMAMSMVERIYLTRIHTELEGDTLFPNIETDQWNLVDDEFRHRDEKNKYDMSFQRYEKIT